MACGDLILQNSLSSDRLLLFEIVNDLAKFNWYNLRAKPDLHLAIFAYFTQLWQNKLFLHLFLHSKVWNFVILRQIWAVFCLYSFLSQVCKDVKLSCSLEISVIFELGDSLCVLCRLLDILNVEYSCNRLVDITRVFFDQLLDVLLYLLLDGLIDRVANNCLISFSLLLIDCLLHFNLTSRAIGARALGNCDFNFRALFDWIWLKGKVLIAFRIFVSDRCTFFNFFKQACCRNRRVISWSGLIYLCASTGFITLIGIFGFKLDRAVLGLLRLLYYCLAVIIWHTFVFLTW